MNKLSIDKNHIKNNTHNTNNTNKKINKYNILNVLQRYISLKLRKKNSVNSFILIFFI